MELHGVTGKPYSHPKTRRALPDTFQRPRIDLDGGTRVKRSWQDVSVLDISKGDTVANFGLIKATVEFVNVDNAGTEEPVWRVRLYNVLDVYQDFSGEQRVFAFTKEKPSE